MKKLTVVLFVLFSANVFSQTPHQVAVSGLKADRAIHQTILKAVKKSVAENYYDPKLRGIDLDAAVKKASELIENANSIEEMDDIVARVFYPFADSHLFYVPPPRTVNVEYGWKMRFYGSKILVTEVDNNSDAFKKGLRPGDQIYMIEDYIPVREEFWLFRYHFETLNPVAALHAIIIKPNGAKYKVELAAKVIRDNVFTPSRRELMIAAQNDYADDTRQLFDDETMKGVAVWRIPTFRLSPIKIGKMMDRVRKNSSLILDLRGNPGGYAGSAHALSEQFFKNDTKMCEFRERKKTTQLTLKGRGDDAYNGKVVVLIDADSASGSEMLSRILQIEKRATIVGDNSAGALMLGRFFQDEFGLDPLIPFGISVTIADIVMSDGKRVEKNGVVPDVFSIPTAADLAAGRDPVLARAAEVLGQKLTPDDAGKLFKSK